MRTLFELDLAQFPPKVAGSAASKSYNYHMGVLLLEKQILARTKEGQTVSRKRKAPGESIDDNQV